LPSDRLFGPSLTTARMAEATSDVAWLAAMLRFESALASAHARAGLIPEPAAERITEACDAMRFDVAAIGREAARSASPVLPLVDALKKAVDQDAAPYVHHEATSQDALDTAMMLVARDGLDLLIADLDRLGGTCATLAHEHRETPIAGRTLLQAALPITFGFKAAMWLEGVDDARRRLVAIRRGGLAVQLGGPVGIFAAREVVVDLATSLDLLAPELPWHSSRGRVASLGAALAVAAGAAAKIALDVALLAQSEVAEVDVAAPGRSTAMPHKRNPAAAVEARAAYSLAVAQAGVLLGAMAGEHERSAGAWQSEWPALGELLRLTAGCVDGAARLLSGLHVDVERMRSNLGPDAELSGIQAAAAIADRAVLLHKKESGDER